MDTKLASILSAIEKSPAEGTPRKIAGSTGIPEDEVRVLLEKNSEWVVQSGPSADGEPLFSSVRRPLIKALEDDRFVWRTIGGLVTDTGFPEEKVRKIIDESRDRIIRSDVPSVDGEPLFTTATHWDRKASASEKLRGAFRNRRK